MLGVHDCRKHFYAEVTILLDAYYSHMINLILSLDRQTLERISRLSWHPKSLSTLHRNNPENT